MMKLDAKKIAHSNSNKTFNAAFTPGGGSPVVDNITVWSQEGYIEQAKIGKFAHKVSFTQT
jgi:hypothetical protein